MADADKAEGNAIDLVLGVDNELVNLMCFYRMAAKIYQRTRGNPLLLAAQVVQDITDMHYATTADDILTAKTRSLKAREKLPQPCSFANYFSTVWLNSAFHPWQVYHTPRGIAATNNPVEPFNRAIVMGQLGAHYFGLHVSARVRGIVVCLNLG
ncbi:hypothetical protein PI125_g24758 [Phytophthora idaei]|nr:hypothetical protein PI125_g24758 [Phytophthora idaei]